MHTSLSARVALGLAPPHGSGEGFVDLVSRGIGGNFLGQVAVAKCGKLAHANGHARGTHALGMFFQLAEGKVSLGFGCLTLRFTWRAGNQTDEYETMIECEQTKVEAVEPDGLARFKSRTFEHTGSVGYFSSLIARSKPETVEADIAVKTDCVNERATALANAGGCVCTLSASRLGAAL